MNQKVQMSMRCACCKIGQMEETKTTYFAELKDCYVIIENVASAVKLFLEIPLQKKLMIS